MKESACRPQPIEHMLLARHDVHNHHPSAAQSRPVLAVLAQGDPSDVLGPVVGPDAVDVVNLAVFLRMGVSMEGQGHQAMDI